MFNGIAEPNYVETNILIAGVLHCSLSHIQAETLCLPSTGLARLHPVRIPAPLLQPIKIGTAATANVENPSGTSVRNYSFGGKKRKQECAGARYLSHWESRHFRTDSYNGSPIRSVASRVDTAFSSVTNRGGIGRIRRDNNDRASRRLAMAE